MHGSVSLRRGQKRGWSWSRRPTGRRARCRSPRPSELLDETGEFWRRWLRQSTYTGRWRETVQRSAITLKLMTYAPTGGMVAAPTAGLPEQVGGERNWDYRYTWVRDGSFSVYALLGMGFTEEATAFCGWLRDRVQEKVGGEGGPLNIMYRVDGSSDLEGGEPGALGGLPRLRARCASATARSDQVQMDIYGEALDSIYFADQRGIQWTTAAGSPCVTSLDWLVDHWDQPGGASGRPAAGRRTSPTAG